MGKTGRFYEGIWDESDQHAELRMALEAALSALSNDPNFSGHLRGRIEALVADANSIYEISWLQSDDKTDELISTALVATSHIASFLLTREFRKWVLK